jgi:hypothetical protein
MSPVGPADGLGFRHTQGFFTRPLVRANLALVRVLLCDISDPFDCDGIQRRHHRSPAAAATPAGRIQLGPSGP